MLFLREIDVGTIACTSVRTVLCDRDQVAARVSLQPAGERARADERDQFRHYTSTDLHYPPPLFALPF